MTTPLVSVICLCYNQKPFVEAAIQSVLNQTYNNIELILVDDGSTDSSKEEIRKTLKDTDIAFIDLRENIGNCSAFNMGFRKSKGEFIIDLAADDMLLPHRVEAGINDFANAPEHTGVHFSDVFLTDPSGKILTTHYKRDPDGHIRENVPSGDVYLPMITRYFVSPPSMMTRREVLEKMGGYDESLSYEDFDFWIRSSREYRYIFNKTPLVKKRILKRSHGTSQFAFRNSHLNTTYAICEKIFSLNRIKEEDKALIARCNYEIRQCIKTFNFGLIPKYNLLKKKTYRRLSSPSSMER